MRAGGRILGLAALGLALAAPGLPSSAEDRLAEDSRDFDPLSVAAEDTWPMQDGCPARTRATRTRPLLGPLLDAWSFKAPGRIQGDPRVWRDWVVVETESDRGRALDVLRLSDGKPVIQRKKFEKASDLQPVLWNDLILVHAQQGRTSLLRIVPEMKMLSEMRVFDASSEPLLVDGDIVTASGSSLQRRRIGREAPLWTASTEGEVLGEIAARHGRAYALVSMPEERYVTPRALLVSVDLATGVTGVPTELGWFADKAPQGGTLTIGDQELFVSHPEGLLLKGGARAVASRVALRGGRPGDSILLTNFNSVAGWGAKTYAGTAGEEGAVFIESPWRNPDPTVPTLDWRWVKLASLADKPEFLPAGGAPVIARGIGLFAGGALDLRGRRVLERNAPRRREVAIPARETLLLVEDGGMRLVARRAARADATATGGPRLSEDPADPKLDVPGATAVSFDGAVRTGKASWSPKDRRLSGLGADAFAFADLGLLLDAGGRVLHGPDPAFVARSLPWATAQKTRADWTALAKRALTTQDLATIVQLVGDLVARGAKPDDILALEKEAARLQTPSPLRVALKDRVAEVAKRRAELVATETASLWIAFSTLPDDVPFGYRIDLLHAVLEKDPENAGAVAWLRGALPDGLVPAGAFPGLEWLEVVEAAWKTKLSLIATKTKPPMTDDERLLAAARRSWRQDLIGLRSDRLLLLTPVAKPGRIARCLSLGEVVCRTLDAMFGLEGEAAASADPLVILLYESQKEYLAQSPAAHEEGEGHMNMEYTLGHYSPGEGASRLFVPEGREAFESVMSTLAHELTHHWLDLRMPPPPGERRRIGGNFSGGYFLEEGFAKMVEEFLFDLRARTWTTLDPRADSLDAVAHAERLMDWRKVYALDYDGFVHLGHAYDLRVPSRWSLSTSLWSETNLFYGQGAATCHWLLEADGGRRKPILLRWMQDLHGQGVGRDSVSDRLGMTPEQLGAAVKAWARQVSDGSR